MISNFKIPLPLLLAMMTAIAPLAIDMYLPAMSLMSEFLQSDIHQVELSVSTFLIGFAVGQITGGPLSDRFGRKPIIMIGLLVYALASLSLVWIQSLDQLLALRVVQAIGGGLTVVNSTAIVRDKFEGKEIAQVLSMVAIIMMTAPLFAPLIGSAILTLFSWNMIFAFLAIYSFVMILILMWQLPESLPPERRNHSRPWDGYKKVITHKIARRYILSLAAGFSGLFVFITASPYLYLEYFNQSETMFPWLFGANVVMIMLANRTNIYMLNHFQTKTLITTGVSLQLVSALGLLILSLSGSAFNLFVVVPLMMIFVGALGFMTANIMGSIMQDFKNEAGSATALAGVTQFCGGAIAGLFWGQIHDHTPVPMMLVMMLTASIAAIAFYSAIRAEQKAQTACA